MTAKICFTMDNLSDAADLGRGVIDKPRLPGNRPALEQGFPALLKLFESFDIKVTHFLEGWNGEAHPDIVADILKRGHSIGMHGWQHEAWSELSLEQELELAEKSTGALEKAAGVRPRSFRAPGGKRTANTVKIISELGYEIDSSLNEQGVDGGEIKALTNTLWHVPHLLMPGSGCHRAKHQKKLQPCGYICSKKLAKMMDSCCLSGTRMLWV